MKDKLERGDIARAIIIEFPNTSKKKLGALLFDRHPLLFNSAEHARDFIRRVTGSQGPGSVRASNLVHNPFNLPDQLHNNNTVNVIETFAGMRIGLLSDIHIPYQSNEALTLAIQHCVDRKIDILYLNGDVLDAYEISSFERDPSKKNFVSEVAAARAFLKTLRTIFPKIPIYFKEGNHEARLTTFLRRRAPELLGFEVLQLKSLLHLDELNIIHVPSKVISKAGKINIVHGHEFAKGFVAPVNPARGFFMKGKANMIGGHHHQDSAHSENTLDGKQLVCYSTGHLADPHPEYHPFNNWSHGFADITFSEGGDFVVSRYKIINGRVINS